MKNKKHQPKFNRLKKFLVILVIWILVIQTVSLVLLYPQKAQAQIIGPVPVPVIDIVGIKASLWEKVQNYLHQLAAIAFKNVLKNFLNRLAYDAAVYVASGGVGQKPMFLEHPEKLLLDTADKAYGDYLDALYRSWSKGACGYSANNILKDSECRSDADCEKYTAYAIAGKLEPGDYGPYGQLKAAFPLQCIKKFASLCEPIDEGVKVKLLLWAQQVKAPKEEGITDQYGRCPVSKMIGNLAGTFRDYEEYLRGLEQSSPRDYLREIAKHFNPEASDYGMFLSIVLGAEEYSLEQKEIKKFVKSLEGEFESLVSPITDAVKTPAHVIGSTLESLVPESIRPYATYTGEAVADAIGTFFNTLTSKLLKQIYKCGLNPRAPGCGAGGGRGGGTGGLFAGIPVGGVSTGIAAAKSIFASLKQPDYNVAGPKDILSEISSCPSEPNINNCVIDEGFMTAVEQKLTVGEAISQGLIDGSKVLGYDVVSQSELNYRNGYPLRSLLILRKYRIVPVGWELAAEYIKEFSNTNFSLQQIIDNYDNCGKCSNNSEQSCWKDAHCGAGTCDISNSSPFCGLIDPTWVLKAPEVYCKREGAGEKIISEETSLTTLKSGEHTAYTKDDNSPEGEQLYQAQIQRMDYCADEQNCVAENEDGSCKKFGYCVEEKQVWRFHGDQCEAFYNTCQTFQTKAGGEVSYLKNTLDYNNCNADNVGCQWYCQDWDSNQSRWTCTGNIDPPLTGNRINLNDKASQCNPSADGCDEFIRTKSGLDTNLVRNSSFELGDKDSVAAGATEINYWPLTGAGVTKTTEDAYFGSNSFKIAAAGANQGLYSTDASVSGLSVLPLDYLFREKTSYTLSALVKVVGAGKVKIGLGSECVTATCDVVGKTCSNSGQTCNVDSDCDMWRAFSTTTDQWERLVVNFPAGENIISGVCDQLNKFIIYSEGAGATFYVDGVQLEEGFAASNYKNYGDVNKIYLNGQRASCTAEEVGCQKYTPTPSGLPVTGVITDPSLCNPADPSSCDQCPAEFVGCKAYREMPVERLPYRKATDPISFISSTGKTCPASSVGCEEYTNLDEVAKGGEGKEYYNFVRLCVTPESPDIAAYYTWVGSDEYGYQLRAYNLKKSNLDNAPCTNIDVDNWPSCMDNAGNIAICTEAEMATNPDCTQFYDQVGNKHYRLKSRIIYVSDNCLPYRNTYTSKDQCVDSNGDGTNDQCLISGESCDCPGVGCQENCRSEECNGGTCSQSGNVCASSDDCGPKIYHIDSNHSLKCAAENAGCREYVGSAGNNVMNILQSNFEGGTISPWSTTTDVALNPSNESIQAGGHSMLVADMDGIPPPNLAYASTSVDTLITKNKSYILSFWAKGAGANTFVNASFVEEAASNLLKSPNNPFSGSASLSANEWNQYSLGPLYLERDVVTGEKLYIFSSSAFYIDNIVLQEVSDDIYLIKDSYVQCSGYENCTLYKDGDNQSHYLKSFSKLCNEDKVGCEVLIDTQNSDNPFRMFFDGKSWRIRGDIDNNGFIQLSDSILLSSYLSGTYTIQPYPEVGDFDNDNDVDMDDVIAISEYVFAGGMEPNFKMADFVVPEDQAVYVVNNPDKYCRPDEQGCTKLGLPTINQNNEVAGFQTVYLVSDPDQYNKTLCNLAETGCGEYTTGEGQYFYFKDPGGIVCEYKNVPGSSGGWYKKDSTSLKPDCPEKKKAVNGGEITIPDTGWVGLCPANRSGCAEYRDPADPVDENAVSCDVKTDGQCYAYFYINSTVDLTTCNGTVNPDEGCMLFADQTQLDNQGKVNLNYNSQTTYQIIKNNRKPAMPVACSADGSDCDSNVVLKVDRDRVCNKWLECEKSRVGLNQKGEKEDLCYELMACSRLTPDINICGGLNECSLDPSNDCSTGIKQSACSAKGGVCREIDWLKVNMTYQSPTMLDEIQNLSGMVMAGMSVGTGANITTIDGYYPYRAMDQIGEGGLKDLVAYGDFGDSDMLSGPEPSITSRNKVPSGWEVKSSCSGDSTKLCYGSNNNTELNQICSNQGVGTCPGRLELVESNKYGYIEGGDNDNVNENNVLKVMPGLGTEDGAYYDLKKTIAKDQEYTLSFKIKYDGDPEQNDQLIIGFAYAIGGKACPDDQNTFCVNPENCSVSGLKSGVCVHRIPSAPFSNFVDGFQPTNEWKDYTFGPLIASSKEGHTYLRFVQKAGSSGRTFYLDDVSLKPVLEANVAPKCLGGVDEGKACKKDSDCADKCVTGKCSLSGNACVNDSNCDASRSVGICYRYTMVPRSCRLYPKSDAPQCTYTDDKSLTYQGWKGYCVEKDPLNPQYCLQWWPVDIIAGETDIFSQREEMGYTGRTPLYMCLQARGNYRDGVTSYFGPFGGPPAMAVFDKYIAKTRPALSALGFVPEFACYNDTGNVDARWRKDGKDLVCVDCALWMYADDYASNCKKTCNLGNCENYCLKEPEDLALVPASYFEKQIHISEVEKVQFVLLDSSGNEYKGWDPLVLTPQDVYKGNNYVWAKSSPDAEGKTPFDYAYITQNTSGSGSRMAFMVKFDENTGYVKGYAFRNAMNLSGSNSSIFAVNYFLREPCTKIVQVVTAGEGKNKAWASRVKGGGYSIDVYNFSYAQDYEPYGSLIVPGKAIIDDPVTWDSRPDNQPLNQPLYVEAPIKYDQANYPDPENQSRAGTPYSCSRIGGCYKAVGGPATMCLGGGKTEGQECNKNYPDCCQTDHQEAGGCDDPNYQGLCIGPQVSNIIYSDLEWGRNKIGKVFAKIYNVWDWDWQKLQYTKGNMGDGNLDGLFPDMTECRACVGGPWNGKACIVSHSSCGGGECKISNSRAPWNDNDKDADFCGIRPSIKDAKVKVGSKVISPSEVYKGEDINGDGVGDGVMPGTVMEFSFVTRADPEQVPLLSSMIDWDGSFAEEPQELAVDGKPGTNTYHVTMNCLTSSDNYVSPPTDRCVYHPMIRIMDNWDWCSGDGVDVRGGTDDDDIRDCKSWSDPGIVIEVRPSA